MKTTIVVEIDHHEAVNVFAKAAPVIHALLNQMYSVDRFSIRHDA